MKKKTSPKPTPLKMKGMMPVGMPMNRKGKAKKPKM
jgi:hypothetical protein